ncbi:MAG: DNA-binding protein [Desulfocurvibacter africanus]
MTMATKESVASACASLVQRGEKVTALKVREELGGGSMATIAPLIRAWRESQARISGAAREREAQPAEPLPDGVQGAIDTLGQALRQALADMRRELEAGISRGYAGLVAAGKERIAELEESLAEAESESTLLAQEGQELQARLDDQYTKTRFLQVKADKRKEDLLGYRAKLEERDAALAALQAKLDEARERAEQAERKLAVSEERAAGEARERDGLTGQLAVLKDDAAGLRTRLGEQNGALEALRRENENLAASAKEAEARALRESQERQEYIERAAKAREEAAGLASQLEVLRASLLRLEAELGESRRLAQSRQAELLETRALAESRRLELEALRAVQEREKADSEARGEHVPKASKSTGENR